MRYASDIIQTKELDARATACVALALAKHAAGNDEELTIEHFAARGWRQFSTHVKTAVNPMLTTDSGSADTLHLAFVAAVDRISLLDKLDAAVRVSVDSRGVRVTIGTITPTVVAEGEIKPVGRYTFDVAGALVKIPGTIIISREMARALDPQSQASIRAQLASPVAAGVDRYLIEQWTADAAITETGATAATVGALLAALSDGAPVAPILIGGWDSLLPLASMLADLRALGVAVTVSPAAAGKLVAVDAPGIALGDGGVAITVAEHANVLMDDGGSPAGTTIINLWQNNLLAIRAERFLFEAHRPDAVAWADASTGSPA